MELNDNTGLERAAKRQRPNEGAHSTNDETSWNDMLYQLLVFRTKTGSLTPKMNDKEYRHLDRWVRLQRREHKIFKENPESSFLSGDQIRVLESIGLSFELGDDDGWYEMYEKLGQFKQIYGHVDVPRICHITGLGEWAILQRQYCRDMLKGKKSPFTIERKELLDEMGFDWKVQNRKDWSSRLQELVTYMNENDGSTRVPEYYSPMPGLGQWVAKQRAQFRLYKAGKRSTLDPLKIEKLDEIGFDWNHGGGRAKQFNSP